MADSVLPANQIRKKKKVGTLDGDSVYQLATSGGLNLVVVARKSGTETLGAGTHPAVALFMARKKADGIKWSELTKAEYVPPEFFSHLLPSAEALTAALRRAEGSE